MALRTYRSGPLQVAEIECYGCEGLGSLEDKRCRTCVLEQLGAQSSVDQVTLRRAYKRVYCSSELSKLARALGALKHLAFDRASYAVGEKGKCKGCVDERYGELTERWNKLLEAPHDLSPIEELTKKYGGLKGECGKCTEHYFLKLIAGIKAGVGSITILQSEGTNYDEVFAARVVPFFVEGVCHPPKHKLKLLESYELPEQRGTVRIYEQLDRPLPFYELGLPELKMPAEHLQLLDGAYKFETTVELGHARFAFPTRIPGFADDWYNLLLHVLRERSDLKIPSGELRGLAKRMSSWLTYRWLDPLSYDDKLTDIYIPAPPELQPIRVVHERWDMCETGIYWTTPALLGLGETLASRLTTSFDEVRPQLDIEIPELGMRLFLSRYPAIWSRSIAISVRKRRRRAWTQPLFIERGTLTPLASSLVSNLIRRGASAFIIGEMGSAKTSEVETLVPEIGPHQRIVAFQDTEELHLDEFVAHGYSVENVRIADAEQLQRQIDAFLRGGAAYWLITEVRAMDAVRAALGAAARQGSQPIVSSFHARSKREMFDLVCRIMGLHEVAFKYVDLIVSTARFSTPRGTIRRVIEVAEVLKDWKDKPEYTELFVDDREHDLLVPESFLRGNKRLLEKMNSYDLSKLNVLDIAKRLEFLSPERGGSQLVPQMCKRFAVDEQDFLKEILAEARMKSDLRGLAERAGDMSYLELPFVSRAYDAYFTLVKENAPEYERVLGGWQAWLKAR
jgi:type IV secretory pathway ATPase VirB11/archaellum biosynthesis ATPase